MSAANLIRSANCVYDAVRDYRVGSAVVQSICSLPKPNVPKGSCRGSDIMRQWFYKADERRCRPFITCSTAVNGEANSFNSSAECAAVCIGELNAADVARDVTAAFCYYRHAYVARSKCSTKTFKCSAERNALLGSYTNT